MDFFTAVHTDVGIKKNTNQDALCLKIASTNLGKVAFAVICDGMGGLSKGELASAEVVRAFSHWFSQVFPDLLYGGISYETVKAQWEEIIFGENRKIMDYGARLGVSLGTTVTAFLIAGGMYYAINVGDSRIYEISESLLQITRDHTFVAREVERGNMTEEQAKDDPRRNVLLQCVGASNVIEPDFFTGPAKPDAVYMLCSDGFRHKITGEEMFNCLNRNALVNQEKMKNNAVYLVELNKQRMEQDNISVALIRTF